MADMSGDDVDSKIRNGKVTVFTEEECSYSKNAVEILKKFNFVPGGLEVVDITGKANVQDYLPRRTKLRAVSSPGLISEFADPLSQLPHNLASCRRG